MSNDHIYPAIGHEEGFMRLAAWTWVNDEQIWVEKRVSPRIPDQTKAEVFERIDHELRQAAEAKLTEAEVRRAVEAEQQPVSTATDLNAFASSAVVIEE